MKKQKYKNYNKLNINLFYIVLENKTILYSDLICFSYIENWIFKNIFRKLYRFIWILSKMKII